MRIKINTVLEEYGLCCSKHFLLCAARGIKVYHQCRSDSPPFTGSNFQINECAGGQIIHIRLVVVGFAQECLPVEIVRRPHESSRPPRTQSSRAPEFSRASMNYSLLNGSGIICRDITACSIPQSVLRSLDREHPPGNFMLVIYDCVNSGKSLVFTRATLC